MIDRMNAAKVQTIVWVVGMKQKRVLRIGSTLKYFKFISYFKLAIWAFT